jgi:glycosyltransferase involved in cell wall biosynthesis
MLAARLGGPDWSWSFTMHGCTELFDERPHRLTQKIGDARLVVCNSDFTRAQLMKLVDRGQWEKLQVVRCGIDPSEFDPPARPAEGEPLRVLSVGRLVPGKGHHVLLEALGRLRDDGIETQTTLVGNGPERESLERVAAELRLDVRFAGAVGQDELRAYYADAHLFCLPTFAEGLGVVLIEAMACGLPVVSSLVMGVPEVVEEGETGLLVSPGRPDTLAAALARLANEPALREQMGAAGRRRAMREFDIGRQGEALAALFGSPAEPQSLINEGQPAVAAA